MADRTTAERDKQLERATSIIGDMPSTDAMQAEREKWDKDGNLIDEKEMAIEKRHRELVLGKAKPRRSDFLSEEWADHYLGKKREGDDDEDVPVAPAIPALPPVIPVVETILPESKEEKKF